MISRHQLDKAIAAASAHIAPCGHNELKNLYAAVEAAFEACDITVEQPVLSPDTVSIADFAGFSSDILATFCERWPGTNEARAAKAELVNRKVLPYLEWCRSPIKCVGKSHCPRNPNCGD